MHFTLDNTTYTLTTLPDFSSARVLVVGDVMLDSYWHGNTNRISPEAPVPVVHICDEEDRVGGAGNVAINAATLGGKSKLLGLVGDDFAARQLTEMVTRQGVVPILMSVPGSRTIKKLRIVSKHQQLLRVDFEDHFLPMEQAALCAVFTEQLRDIDVVVLSDYAKGSLRDPAALIAAARAAGKPIVVDPKGRDFARYRGATLITPNMSEFEAVVGPCPDEEAVVSRGEALRVQLDLEALLITRSEKGMTLLLRDHAPMHIPTHAREVFDVTGAGDTVVATIAVGLAAGVSLPKAVVLSNIAAGIVVAKLGTATVSTVELQRALHDGSEDQNAWGACSEAELLPMLELARARGERIVMTHGDFEQLDASYIDYFESARALGDRLIVAVNENASLSPLAGRMRILSSLREIDWVVDFSDDSPARQISAIRPDVLVLRNDASPEQIAEAKKIQAAGGEVVTLNCIASGTTNGTISTTTEASA